MDRLVPRGPPWNKRDMSMRGQLFETAGSLLRPLLDYALPPRCPGCGLIVLEQGSFCADCWGSIRFLDEPLCQTCGRPLEGAVMADLQCGACLADPPPFDRARAVLDYGDVGRTIAHRLKYGRRVSLAQTMARFMARCRPVGEDPTQMLLVPVPLHRWRIWSRGFNQSALLARHLAQQWQLPCRTDLLRRTVNTPPLHSLGPKARHKVVRGAFALAPSAQSLLKGRTIILVDDILTTGATAAACARILKSGGAARVELLCWARAGPSPD